ncbi:testis-expressed protein 47-like [Frankliniella occidentalis]|uniref:Testis-expressed protein 47-like n=1 Tax=Frankliniella occidentalis TaxID=133901 RepID=A0A6J1S426_FRAOC|nr:testis-expressed protein 47-like [Frankliniella occidentalis]
MEARQSMLDVVKNCLLSSGRSTYLHRLLYVGEHGLGRGGLEEFMKNVVSAQGDQLREEGLTGFLLVYQDHFIHLVEGSESTLTRHLQRVVDPGVEEAPKIKRVKVIFEATHINKRCLSSWTSRSASPPKLAAVPKAGAAVAETARQVDAVLGKTLRMLDALKKLPPGAPLSGPIALQLPEPELLEALLASPLVRDVRALLEEQRVPPRITLYEDVVWPMQSDFVPYDLLKQPAEQPEDDEPQDESQGKDEEEADEAGRSMSREGSGDQQRVEEEELEEEGDD